MRIKLYNSAGSVILEGRPEGEASFGITAVEGLGLPEKRFDTVTYAGMPGHETVNCRAEPRTITISADIPGSRRYLKKYAQLMTILDDECTIEISDGTMRRKINGRCCEFVQGELYGEYRTYVIQFICDYPYFTDLSQTETNIYRRIDMIDDGFILPGVLTKRISEGDIGYLGSTPTAPIFEIEVISAAADMEEILIENTIHGEFIRIYCDTDINKKITVDLENGRITDSAGNDLMGCISDDSFLDEFHLHPGSNCIKVTNSGSDTAMRVTCRYTNKYLEAVGGC